jgi:hypothetical protein
MPEVPTQTTDHPDSAKAVRDWLQKQGHSLEHHAAAAFAPKSGDPAHAALAQVVSAATGLLDDEDLFPNPAVFHPVIVLDGELFRATFETYHEVRVEAIGRERIHWSGTRIPVVIRRGGAVGT